MMTAKELLTFPFKLIYMGFKYLFMGNVLNSKTGAGFAKKSEYSKYLSAHNTGLLLNGVDLKLSDKDSFQNVAVMARIGAGKTSRYIIPNVLAKAHTKCSLVVNDPKGEVFANTSAFMKQNGFKVIVVDPENIEHSSFFNPLLEATNEIELEQIAEILVRCSSANRGGGDDFWQQGAMRFVSLFLKVLKNAGKQNPAYFTLHNLYYLFQNFGEDGSNLENFMNEYTANTDDPFDESLWHEYQGVLTGNEEGVKSFILNAITSLKALSNKNIAKITSKSDINLTDIRNTKTIIYLITPAQHAEYYSFFTSLFFRSVFNACMRQMPDRKTLPVYILYDEFGHSTIPNFVSTANTIRGYKVSLSIILQSISQLHARYGSAYANSIQGGFNTYLTYAGADPDTSNFFEQIIGKVRERQRKKVDDTTDEYREYNLINSAEVRMIEQDQALIVSANRQAIQIKTTPYFQNWTFGRQARAGACEMEHVAKDISLEYVDLANE
jgi:type IV secretory pathway TraG/TraD family ATPase VirD4